MKVLVIGAAGFVGGHLINLLCSLPEVEAYATKLENENIESKLPADNIINLDILDRNKVDLILGKLYPDYIIHLAAQSSVSFSWKAPALTYNINVIGAINVLEAVRKANICTRLLFIGSAEEYGNVKLEELPINESANIVPGNPYAISKVSQEMAALLYKDAYKMDIVLVRAFNHIGPGQSPTFALPGFAKQIAEIEKGIQKPVILTGNLDAKRDFTDVRDIVRGYWGLLQRGKSGEIYNIGSGRSFSIRNLLNRLIGMSSMKIEVQTDPDKLRPVDIPELRADISKIQSHIDWQPQIEMDKTLSDTLDYWRMRC
jgi:GDP-4-dehydro-6-deoxy-D-mannose reductase